MLKKLLTLSLVAVMLSTVAFASGITLAEATYAETGEFTTTTIDKIVVKASAAGDAVTYYSTNTTSESTKLLSSATPTTTTASWAYYRYDISGISEMSSVTDVTVGLYARFNKNGNFYLYALDEDVWTAAYEARGTTVEAGSFANPHKEEDKNLLGRVKMAYKNATYQFPIKGESATDSTLTGKTATYYAGNLKSYVEQAVLNGEDYIYISVCLTPQNSSYDNDASNGSSSIYFANGVNANCLTIVGGNTPACDDFSDADIDYNKETGVCTVTTATTSGTAMLIVASFNGTTMVDAKVVDIDAADAVEGVISENITGLDAGSSVKVFLWNPTTLVPAIEPATF